MPFLNVRALQAANAFKSLSCKADPFYYSTSKLGTKSTVISRSLSTSAMKLNGNRYVIVPANAYTQHTFSKTF